MNGKRTGMDELIIIGAQYLYLVVLVSAGVVWLTRPRRGRQVLALMGVVSGVVCLGLIKLAGGLYFDPRPFAVRHLVPLVPHPPDNGFPSDHTALTMVVSLSVLTVSRRWGLVLIALSLVVGTARVAAGLHSPLDIAAGVVIALAGAAIGRLACWRALRPDPTPQT
jgi:undecaprenyl-diphosphatase